MYIVCAIANLFCAGLTWPSEMWFPGEAEPGNQIHCAAASEANWVLEYLMPWGGHRACASVSALLRQEPRRRYLWEPYIISWFVRRRSSQEVFTEIASLSMALEGCLQVNIFRSAYCVHLIWLEFKKIEMLVMSGSREACWIHQK